MSKNIKIWYNIGLLDYKHNKVPFGAKERICGAKRLYLWLPRERQYNSFYTTNNV